jgi:hypothetical protein
MCFTNTLCETAKFHHVSKIEIFDATPVYTEVMTAYLNNQQINKLSFVIFI